MYVVKLSAVHCTLALAMSQGRYATSSAVTCDEYLTCNVL